MAHTCSLASEATKSTRAPQTSAFKCIFIFPWAKYVQILSSAYGLIGAMVTLTTKEK